MNDAPAVFAGIPNPVGWVIDEFKGFLGGVAETSAASILGVLVSWVVDAAVWVVGGIVNFFLDASDPNVQAEWFVHGGDGYGPYLLTATIGAVLLVGFFLVGVVQGVLAGDVGGMLHRLVVHTPAAVLGMVGIVGVTQALVRLVDYLSVWVLSNFSEDLAHFTTVVASIQSLHGGVATAFAIFLLALIVAVMGLVVFAELVVRGALIYIVVALAPLAFAVLVWPAMRTAAKRLCELLLALILSKLVIAVALATAAAALSGAGTGGNLATEAIPEPQPLENGVFAEDEGGSVTQAVGILLAGAAALSVAAFSPLLAAKLFPLTEAALVSQGVRGMPLRGAQQAMGTSSSLAVHKARGPVGLARAGIGPPATARQAAVVGGGEAPAGFAGRAVGARVGEVGPGSQAGSSRAAPTQSAGRAVGGPGQSAGQSATGRTSTPSPSSTSRNARLTGPLGAAEDRPATPATDSSARRPVGHDGE